MSEANPPAAAPQATPQPGQKLVTELKVSGHLMTFDAGLYCIFLAPGSPPADAATGLPGVRVTVAPGPAFRPESVTISGFRDDGWIGGADGAALVRVSRGPASLLVTIYQAPNTAAEAPRLQIMKLQEGVPANPPRPAAEAQATEAPPAADTSEVEVLAHIQGRGDVAGRLGETIGVAGSHNWIEGFALVPKHLVGVEDIEYQAVLGRGWLSPWSEGGQFCGSRGMSLPILGLRARLKGEKADQFDCVLTATFTDGTAVGPIDNGEPAQAESLAPLESFRIELIPRGASPAAAPKEKKSAKTPAKKK